MADRIIVKQICVHSLTRSKLDISAIMRKVPRHILIQTKNVSKLIVAILLQIAGLDKIGVKVVFLPVSPYYHRSLLALQNVLV
jgi:2-methylisocitrate lyase-like PEP mutase family enzyme